MELQCETYGKKMIFAVDFDGTLCENAWPEIGAPNMELLNFLVDKRKEGHDVILWTMREGMKLDEAVNWCKLYGLTFDSVNNNLKRMQAFYGNNPRKVYADIYIDDHNSKNDWGLPFKGGI